MSKKYKPSWPNKEKVKKATERLNEMDISNEKFLAMLHDELDLEYGEVFEIWETDPEYFGIKKVK